MKTVYTETYAMSKTFNAPLDFVFDWCTDFREDDQKMVGSTNRRNILERTGRRVVWVVEKKEKGKTDPIRAVWLSPPDSWHLETCGDKNEIGDYRLVPVGNNRTRLEMTFTVVYKSRAEIESKESYVGDTLDHWNKYGRHLESDYKASKS